MQHCMVPTHGTGKNQDMQDKSLLYCCLDIRSEGTIYDNMITGLVLWIGNQIYCDRASKFTGKKRSILILYSSAIRFCMEQSLHGATV